MDCPVKPGNDNITTKFGEEPNCDAGEIEKLSRFFSASTNICEDEGAF